MVAVWRRLADAERELPEAQAQLDGARDDLRQHRDRVEQLALTDDAVGHAREFHAWQAAKARIEVIEARVSKAEAALREARQDAAAASMAEARRRHEVILRAAQTLAADLKQLQQLEDALSRQVAELPQAVLGSPNCVGGTVRDVAVVTAAV